MVRAQGTRGPPPRPPTAPLQQTEPGWEQQGRCPVTAQPQRGIKWLRGQSARERTGQGGTAPRHGPAWPLRHSPVPFLRCVPGQLRRLLPEQSTRMRGVGGGMSSGRALGHTASTPPPPQGWRFWRARTRQEHFHQVLGTQDWGANSGAGVPSHSTGSSHCLCVNTGNCTTLSLDLTGASPPPAVRARALLRTWSRSPHTGHYVTQAPIRAPLSPRPLPHTPTFCQGLAGWGMRLFETWLHLRPKVGALSAGLIASEPQPCPDLAGHRPNISC